MYRKKAEHLLVESRRMLAILIRKYRSVLLSALVTAYAGLIRASRNFQRDTARGFLALVLPPASPGSLGDEAIETALVRCLKIRGARRIGFISHTAEDSWAHLGSVSETINMESFFRNNSRRGLLRLMRVIGRYDRFYVLGTDVLDGGYSDKIASSRLTLALLADKAGARTSVISFSLNQDPTSEAINGFRNLPTSVRLYARDPISCERLGSHLKRPVTLAADLGFLLEPIKDSELVLSVQDWIQRERNMGRLVIGINANPQLVAIQNEERLDDLREAYVSVIVGLYESYRPSFLFIPHDFRSELSDVVFTRMIIEGIPHEIQPCCFQVPEPYKAAEVKGICADLDIVLSGRMHCTIACLGQGTPVASITYQDKFEGLYKHFDLEGMTLSAREAMKPGRLLEFFTPLVEDQERIRKTIERKLPEVEELAWINLK